AITKRILSVVQADPSSSCAMSRLLPGSGRALRMAICWRQLARSSSSNGVVIWSPVRGLPQNRCAGGSLAPQAQYPEHPYPSQHPRGAEGEEAQKGYEHGVFYMAHIDYVGVRRGGDRQAQAHQQAQSSMEFHSRNHHAFSPVLLKETLPLQWAI